MSLFQWLMIILGTITSAFAMGAVWLNRPRQSREPQYHLKVKFAQGVKTKLVLNQIQYDQFRAWLERPDGLWDIGDDNAFVSLNRQNVACVEVRKR